MEDRRDETSAYGLTPLQHGMLFHALSNPGQGVDIEQVHFRVSEEFDEDRFVSAWESVMARHEILRTSFDWTSGDEPSQLVRDDVTLPLHILDWTGVDSDQHDARFRELRQRDRSVDFPMDQAPLMRMTVIRSGPAEWKGLWTFHHALLDGRSFPFVLGEVFDLYEGAPIDTLPARRPFRDHVEFVRSLAREPAERFWTAYLDGFEAPTTIDVPSPDAGGGRPMAAAEWKLSPDSTGRLRRFAAGLDLSLNTLLQAAWSLLLHHYSTKHDVVFGATRACRYSSVAGADEMVGLLINTVPMRVAVDPTASLAEFLRLVREQQLAVRDYEHTPLPSIQSWSPLPSNVPLFDTIVVYDDRSLGARMEARSKGTTADEFVYEGQTNYPLTLLAYGDEEMLLRVEHSAEHLDGRSADRLVRQLAILLEAMPAHAQSPATLVPYLTDEEKSELAHWNATDRDYDLDTCLHYLFEQQVDKSPDSVALVAGDRRLTYDELNRRSNQLAHFLRAAGIGRDIRVGVCADRSADMVVALYAIIKAGGAYVPLDPEYPADRLAFMMEDSAVPVLLTQDHLVDRLPEYEGRLIALDGDWAEIAAHPDHNPEHLTTPTDLAYVLYTSGSTGRPKGVMNEHRGIVNRLLWMQDAFGLDGTDRVLQKTPFSFDVSVWEFFWPLQVGARLVMAAPGGHRDGAYLVRTVRDEGITTMHFVPSMLQLLVEEPGLESCTSLRRVICSGEALPRDLQDRLLSRLEVELHNLYGPTEAAIDVSWWRCDPDSRLGFVPIGRAIANTRLYVLDQNLRPVPVGVAGQLHIGGVQVARGYLNRDELTAEKFIDDPFVPGGRLYATGDLARFMPDGNVEFLGRLDHQVKLRGFRIELGEIEAVMNRHPDVKEAIVLAREDTPGDTRLVGYLVATGVGPDLEDLRSLLSSQLADYMVPSAFVVLDSFPLTPNGKIDRKVLPPPDRPAGGEAIAPASEAERRVAAIWQSILDLERVGATDTFFDLGGHSLLVMRLANRLAEEFGRQVAVADVFRFPTVERQARFLSQETDADEALLGTDEAARRQRTARARQRMRASGRGPATS